MHYMPGPGLARAAKRLDGCGEQFGRGDQWRQGMHGFAGQTLDLGAPRSG